MNFNRERFLLCLLTAMLSWQAAIFTYGVVVCSKITPTTNIKSVCPDLGDRFDSFTQTTLGAVLGLLAGSATLTAVKKKKKEEDKEY